MWHILKAFKIQVGRLVSSVAGGKILSESTISYDEERPLEDLDLIYKKAVEDMMPPDPVAADMVSVSTISGLTVIDWYEGERTDANGDTVEDSIWVDYFGEFPVFEFYVPIEDEFVKQDLPFLKLEDEGGYQIDATGLVDVIMIVK